jgi:hypothetical protein
MFKKLSLALAAAIAVWFAPVTAAAQAPTSLFDLSQYANYTGLIYAYMAYVDHPQNPNAPDSITTKAYKDAYAGYLNAYEANQNMIATLNGYPYPPTGVVYPIPPYQPFIFLDDYFLLQSSYNSLFKAQKEALAAFNATGDQNSHNAYLSLNLAYQYMYYYITDFFLFDSNGNLYFFDAIQDSNGVWHLAFFPLLGAQQ